MADYCTIDEVRSILPGGTAIDDQTGFPTKETVLSILAGVTGRINVAFKKGGISLPLADTDAIADTNLREKQEVAYQVKVIQGAISGDKVEPLFKEWHEEFEAWLISIAETGYAGLTSSSDTPWSHTRDADETDPSDDRNPTFVKDYDP